MGNLFTPLIIKKEMSYQLALLYLYNIIERVQRWKKIHKHLNQTLTHTVSI